MRIGVCLVAVVGLMLVAGAYVVGGRAGPLDPAPHPTADVVGMPLPVARALLRPGGARLVITRVAWAPAGIVAAIRGYGYDGAHTSNTVLRLEVGR